MCAIFLLFCAAVSMIGAAWFRHEAGKSWFRKPFMCATSAAINMLKEQGCSRPVNTAIGAKSFYDMVEHSVMLAPDVQRRRDLQSVSIAMHEAGHAIQHKRLGTYLMVLTGLVPPAVMLIAAVDLFAPFPGALILISALIMLRAALEADAWFIANHVLKRWQLPGVPKRMIAAGVMSYL